jgi:hypothetical protein
MHQDINYNPVQVKNSKKFTHIQYKNTTNCFVDYIYAWNIQDNDMIFDVCHKE